MTPGSFPSGGHSHPPTPALVLSLPSSHPRAINRLHTRLYSAHLRARVTNTAPFSVFYSYEQYTEKISVVSRMATPQVESIENYPLLSEEDENEFVCKPQASEDATAPIGCNSEIVGSDEEDGNNLKCVTDHFPANRNVPRNAKYLLEVVIRSWFLKEAVMLLKLALPLVK